MPENNLTVSIGFDTSRLRADRALVEQELKKVNQAVKDAAKAGDAQALRTQTEQADKLSRQYVTLSRSINIKTRATEQDVQANRREALSLREVGEQSERLLKVFGLHAEVLKGLKFGLAGLVGAGVIRSLNDVVSRFQELRKLGSESGFGTQTTQVLQEGFKRANVAAEDANASIGKLGDAFREAQQKALESGQRVGGEIEVITGKTKDATNEVTNFGSGAATVFHGTQKEVVDFHDKLKGLHVDIKQFPNTEQGYLDFLKAVQRGFKDLQMSGRTAEADIRARQFGLPLQDFMAGLTNSIRHYEQIVKELRTQGALFTPEDKARIEAYTQAVNKATTAFEGLQTRIAVTVLPDLTEWLERLNKEVDEHGVAKLWDDFLGKKDFENLLDVMLGHYRSFVNGMNALDRWLKTTHDALWKGIGSAVGAVTPTQPPETAAGQGLNAAGGYIRGPGTGTSDSIPARLSNGEFVVNAASVRRLGVGFLADLNNFRDGGYVPRVHFAEGGLAGTAAAASTPIHLHIGGGAYPMSASSGVAAALVGAAKHSQMVSSGIKPSWYGR